MPKIDSQFVSDELARCNRCGFCIRTCPTYRVTGSEGNVARARNELVRSVQRGDDELMEEMYDRFFQCLMCGACTDACLTDVETDEIMVEAREAYRDTHGHPWLQRFIFRELLPYPDKLARYVRMISLGKNTGISGLARNLGLLKIVSQKLAKADSLVEKMPPKFFRDQMKDLGFEDAEDLPEGYLRLKPAGEPTGPSVAYFVGCGSNFQVPSQVVGAIRLMSAGGCDIIVPPNCCCGLPPYSYGDREAARVLAEMNVKTLSAIDVDVIVTECGSCSSFLKKYPKLLAESDLLEAAEALQGKTRDATEILFELDLPEPREPDLRVTYHDPCHLGRKQKITKEPREMLTRIPGVELVEMKEADWCCGGAGSYNMSEPEMSDRIIARKTKHVAETSADVLVTACPACVIQLARGVREAGLDMQVKHLSEVMEEAYLPPVDAGD
ncbi:MAG TPA: (Fe-S)-binding protein [Armatimonadota bacterium]|nr:(Fe-S)-binding protein [Armatimonadota bacterium]